MRSRFALRKPTSNEALWATITAPRANSRNEGMTVARDGAPATDRSLIPVRWVMAGGIGRSGSTSVWNDATRSAPSNRTAPISVIASSTGEPPVVSRSTTTNETSSSGIASPSTVWTGSPTTRGGVRDVARAGRYRTCVRASTLREARSAGRGRDMNDDGEDDLRHAKGAPHWAPPSAPDEPVWVLELELHHLAGARGVAVATERDGEPIVAVARAGEARPVLGVEEAVAVPVGQLLHGHRLGAHCPPRPVAVLGERDGDRVARRCRLEQPAGADLLVGLGRLQRQPRRLLVVVADRAGGVVGREVRGA